PGLGAIVGGEGLLAGNPGIVEGAVEPAEAAHRLVPHGRHVRLAGDVGADEAGLAPRRLDEAHRLVTALGGNVRDDYPRALAREGERGGPADARGGAGD